MRDIEESDAIFLWRMRDVWPWLLAVAGSALTGLSFLVGRGGGMPIALRWVSYVALPPLGIGLIAVGCVATLCLVWRTHPINWIGRVLKLALVAVFVTYAAVVAAVYLSDGTWRFDPTGGNPCPTPPTGKNLCL